MDTDELRRAFRADVQLAGPPPTDPYEGVLARQHTSDRRRLASIAAGLTVALVAVAVPIGISLVGVPDAHVAGPAPIPDVGVFAEPTRGSLADDTGFVDGVLQKAWAVPGVDAVPEMPNAPLKSRHVVFAGDVAAGRWALVVGANTIGPTGDAGDPARPTDLGALSDIAAVWFVGPAGASPEQMVAVTVPRGIPADKPTSLYDGISGALVVVSAPGDVIEVSTRPDVAADANVTRTYTAAETAAGVAVVAVDPNPFSSMGLPALQYRVTRGGVLVAEGSPESYTSAGPVQTSPQLQYLRPPTDPGRGGVDLAAGMAAEILGEYGLDPDEVEIQVHYADPVPGAGGTPAELAVLTATLPGGAVLIRADWIQQLGAIAGPDSVVSYGRSSCVNELSPAGVPAAERPLAMRCDIFAGPDAATESTLIVLVPPGLAARSVTAQAIDSRTEILLSEAVPAGGVVMVAFPRGARNVLIAAPDGVILGRATISAP